MFHGISCPNCVIVNPMFLLCYIYMLEGIVQFRQLYNCLGNLVNCAIKLCNCLTSGDIHIQCRMNLASSTQCPTNVSWNQLSQQCHCQSHVPVVLYTMRNGPDDLGDSRSKAERNKPTVKKPISKSR
jgi:hypothetical protein